MAPLLVIVASTVAASAPAALIEAAVRVGGTQALGLAAVASVSLLLTTVSTSVVLSSVVRSAVRRRSQAFSLWRVVGALPSQVSTVVSLQLFLTAAVGAALGTALAAIFLPSLLSLALESSSGLGGIRTPISVQTGLATAGLVVIYVAVVGAAPAHRAGYQSPIQVLNDTGDSPRPALKLTSAGLLALVAGWMTAGLPSSLPTGAAQSVLIGPVLVAATAAAGPWVFPAASRAWSAVIRPGWSAAWFVARAHAIQADTRTGGPTAPLLVAIGLPVTFLVGQRTVETANSSGGSGDSGALALILGGPVLLAIVGAAARIFMSNEERGRASALMGIVGAGTGTRGLFVLWEVTIHVATATLVSALLAVAVGLSIVAAVRHEAPDVHAALEPDALAAVVALSAVFCLPAALLPALFAMRRRPIEAITSGGN
ncbi:FtsX-like permease family protein [Protaetiibacter intestinalis]|uniref:FtsX-like permease family protein n=1 Tax=Protaetiibacter intestinalis TaxID=2419774 RepID=UPI001300AC7D|nr:FtsX-like permease family protein [Protaetiibacter intestinalis]